MRSIEKYRPHHRARKRTMALPALLVVLAIGGCESQATYRDADARTGTIGVNWEDIFIAGEKQYSGLTDAQRAAFDTVRQEFPDPVEHPTFIVVGYTQALYPELFGLKEPNMYLKLVTEARQKKIQAAITAASQTAISSQMTLNAPSQDASANPTALDSRRSETANGHPSY